MLESASVSKQTNICFIRFHHVCAVFYLGLLFFKEQELPHRAANNHSPTVCTVTECVCVCQESGSWSLTGHIEHDFVWSSGSHALITVILTHTPLPGRYQKVNTPDVQHLRIDRRSSLK